MLLLYNANPPRSRLWPLLGREPALLGHLLCVSSLRSPRAGRWRRLAVFLLAPLHIALLCRGGGRRGLHLVLMSQPPLLQPLLGWIAAAQGCRVSCLLYDFYPSILLPRLPRGARRLGRLLITPAWRRFLVRCSQVWVLSEAMAERVRTDLHLPQLPIGIERVGDHNPARPLAAAGVTEVLEHDIAFLGSLSATHTLEGLLRLLRASDRALRLAVSDTIARRLLPALEPLHRRRHVIHRLPFLPEADLELLLRRSAYGFASLQERDLGTCYPSRVLTYLAHGCPVLFDGPPAALDHLLSRSGAGTALLLQKASPEQVRALLPALLDDPHTPRRAAVRLAARLVEERRPPLNWPALLPQPSPSPSPSLPCSL